MNWLASQAAEDREFERRRDQACERFTRLTGCSPTIESIDELERIADLIEAADLMAASPGSVTARDMYRELRSG